jgi:hypothetical protein
LWPATAGTPKFVRTNIVVMKARVEEAVIHRTAVLNSTIDECGSVPRAFEDKVRSSRD